MKLLVIMTLIATGLFAPIANAQEQGHLNVLTVVQKEEITVTDSGETERRLVSADTVVPGDDVVYTITFTNISDETAENIVIPDLRRGLGFWSRNADRIFRGRWPDLFSARNPDRL